MKNSKRFFFTSYQTRRQNKPTSRDGTLKEGPTRRYMRCSSPWKSWRRYTKEGYLPKTLNSQKPPLPLLTGRKGEENTPRCPTPIRDALSSAIEAMQAIRAMSQTDQKRHAWCMAPGTLQKSVNSWDSPPRSATRSILTSTSNPALDATSAAKSSSLRTPQKR